MVKIAIIANPISNISTEKFLKKFSILMASVSDTVYIINDGIFDGHEDCKVITATHHARKIKSFGSNFFVSLLFYFTAQVGYVVGLMKCIKNIDNIVVFPITMFSPVLVGKIAGKKIILYEAQDVYCDYNTTSILGYLRFQLLWLSRNITLSLVDSIIIEGEHVVPPEFREAHSAKIRICPQYVEDAYTIKKPYSNRENIIGYIAFLEKRKGAVEYAKAVHVLAGLRDDFRFYIVGRGPLSEEIEEILSSEILSQRVKLIEFVSEENFPDFLNELKLYVLPSLSEGLPNTVLEAMACGTPVLVTPVGAIPDIIQDRCNGFILNDVSPSCIAESILSSMDAPNMGTIVDNAQTVILREYTLERAIERYSSIFK